MPWRQALKHPRRILILGLAAAVAMALALSVLIFAQVRQHQELTNSAGQDGDDSAWAALLLGRDHLLLTAALAQALAGPDPAPLELVTARYQSVRQQQEVLRRDSGTVAHEVAAHSRAVFKRLDDFAARVEPLLGTGSTATHEQLRPLLETARENAPMISELILKSRDAVAGQAARRDRELRQRGVWMLALALAQIVAALTLATALWVGLRRLTRQHADLRALTDGLRAARAEADAANLAKSRFLANMSHEIRTPFQGLLGMLNLLDESAMEPRQRDYLHTARESAHQLLSLLNDLMDASTLELGTLTLTERPLDLHDLVTEVAALTRAAASAKGLALRVEIDEASPRWVRADAQRVRQILFNLLGNAIKFTDQGQVALAMRARPDAPGITVEVSDTGAGMDEQTLARLFSPFHQADAAANRRHQKGPGLGLEIARHLARMMGGDVSASSVPARGSTFTVTLPLVAVPPPATAAAPAPAADRPLRVLAADDHPINLKYMSILLERMGHEATLCENGVEALEQASTRDFDVVLMDLHMPVMDGLEATRRIRALPPPAGTVPVILITADTVNDARDRALAAGISAFATKPLQADDLRRLLGQFGLLGGQPPNAATQFPVSFYEAPADSPVTQPPPIDTTPAPLDLNPSAEPQPLDYIDGPTLREVLAMMPPESLDALLHELFHAPHGAVQSLLREMDREDCQAIGQAAHKLKGSCMLLGLKALVKTTAALEHTARRTQDPIDHRTRAILQVQVDQTLSTLASLGVRITPP